MRFNIWYAIAGIVFCCCTGPMDHIRELSLGMTTGEVIDILGPTTDITVTDTIEKYVWSDSQDGTTVFLVTVFKYGRLASYGPFYPPDPPPSPVTINQTIVHNPPSKPRSNQIDYIPHLGKSEPLINSQSQNMLKNDNPKCPNDNCMLTWTGKDEWDKYLHHWRQHRCGCCRSVWWLQEP